MDLAENKALLDQSLVSNFCRVRTWALAFCGIVIKWRALTRLAERYPLTHADARLSYLTQGAREQAALQVTTSCRDSKTRSQTMIWVSNADVSSAKVIWALNTCPRIDNAVALNNRPLTKAGTNSCGRMRSLPTSTRMRAITHQLLIWI